MKQGTAIALLGAAAVALAAVAGIVFFWPQEAPPPAPAVPPLPPGSRSFDNWALACQRDAQNVNRCSLLIRVLNRDNRQLVMSLSLTRGPQGRSIMVVTTPPGIAVPAGVTLTPVNGTAVKGDVQTCRPNGCTAVVVLNDMTIMELSGAPTTTVGYVAANGQNVNLNLPTQGFAAGYSAWLADYPPPPATEEAPADEAPAATP